MERVEEFNPVERNQQGEQLGRTLFEISADDLDQD